MNIKSEYPTYWKDYELIDCGDFQKLERFGKYVFIRPEPQALWSKKLSETEWNEADVVFVGRSPSTGDWRKKSGISDRWEIGYKSEILDLKFRLALTAFKHVGIFPEQAVNWEYIANSIRRLNTTSPRFLNLFAYTGGASIAARHMGAEVTHVDSIKQVVTWANDNMQLSGLTDIRWMVDDAVKFVKRELRRGNTYHGIILDPPAYGHGPKGEKWKLEDMINDLVSEVCQLLDPEEHFLILNTYSLGFSALVTHNLLNEHLPQPQTAEIGELMLQATSGLILPLGVYGRCFYSAK
jgi:23S rRNA (cytosine1962-C5)-methyltransferase